MLIIITILLDAILVNVNFIFAYILKFKIVLFDNFVIHYGNFVPHANFADYLDGLYIVSIIWIVLLWSGGVYSQKRGLLADVDEVINIVIYSFFAAIIIVVLNFTLPLFPQSRFIMIYFFLLNVISISIVHMVIFFISNKIIKAQEKYYRVLIIGTNDVAQTLYERLLKYYHRFEIVGMIGPVPEKIIYAIQDQVKFLGDYNKIDNVIETYDLDEIILATNDISFKSINIIISRITNKGLSIKVIPYFYDIFSGRVSIDNNLGIPLYGFHSTLLSKKQLIIKRFMDILFSLILLILLCPLMLILALFIRLESKGSALFKQERIGKEGVPFHMYKLRTMPQGIEDESGPMINKDDSSLRATKLGTFLRKSSLDELPQLLNILKGEMSFVGPRPERAFFVNKFNQELLDYHKRHLVIPGLTGWAQINGRAALSARTEEKLMYDLYYINNWSFLFDVKIMMKTILYVLSGKGAI